MTSIYEQLIQPERARLTSVMCDRTIADEASSDRSRIVYCSPFRRLQEKAQVFALEGNAAVRTRLTHTLEVADVGRLIAQRVTGQLVRQGLLPEHLVNPFIQIVENACLMHDIGNPPFGHFGEEAVKRWFRENWKDCYEKSRGMGSDSEIVRTEEARFEAFLGDFIRFDGNPQGIRIVTSLQWNFDDHGLNLTHSQILACLKYPDSSSHPVKDKGFKKPGYFQSEADVIDKARMAIGIEPGRRYPLTYIMEAADDIAYCISDIEDGIEKGIVSERQFALELSRIWRVKLFKRESTPSIDLMSIAGCDTQQGLRGFDFFKFKTNFTRTLIDRAATIYAERHNDIINGNMRELFEEGSDERLLLDSLKELARRLLFRSLDVEKIELAGYSIIRGLLESHRVLLECSLPCFFRLVECLTRPNALQHEDGLDVEWRLMHRLPTKYVTVYKHALSKETKSGVYPEVEWFHRAHLIVDYITGMTDRFALDTFQILTGVSVG